MIEKMNFYSGSNNDNMRLKKLSLRLVWDMWIGPGLVLSPFELIYLNYRSAT
ncbi:hypothetical protein HanIR_Chr04g0165391 [Helianthus annuus]|nr:hypothetical protein HanIR_Chr04g0165391 [Helianthus annuus]